MSPHLPVAYGIDIGKQFLDLARSDTAETLRVANTPAGHLRILELVGERPEALIVLEPTSRYHRQLVATLTAAGRQPAAINPYQARHYAKGMRKRLKSDAADARVLADYGARVQPTPRPLPSETEDLVADLITRREDLVAAKAAEQTRLDVASRDWERASIERHIAFLAGEIRSLDQMLKATIRQDQNASKRNAILISAPGISHTTASVLIGLLPELGTLTRKTAAALVGVAPYDRQSGASDRSRHISGGRSRVRKALYMMAITAVRKDPTIKARFLKLRATKPFKVALIAVVRQMLGVLNAMLRDNITWHETKIGRGEFLP